MLFCHPAAFLPHSASKELFFHTGDSVQVVWVAHTAYSGCKSEQSFIGQYVPKRPPMRMTLDICGFLSTTLRKSPDKSQVRVILQNTWPVSTPQNC